MQMFLRDTELYHRLFNATHSRIGRCELLACEQVAQGQLLQGIAFVGALMDAGIVCLNAGMDSLQATAIAQTNPRADLPLGDVNTERMVKPSTTCPDMRMFAKQMVSPFISDENRRLVISTDRNDDRQAIDNVVAAYQTNAFQVQLAEMLALIRPSAPNEPSQFAGVMRDWFESADNKQAALALRDIALKRMNVSPSNEAMQALAHEPGAYRLQVGSSIGVDNPAYASSSTSGVRAPDINTGAGRLLAKMQVASRMTALGHAQIFAAHGVHGVVTQSAPVNGMAHIFLGGGTGRLM